MLSFNTLSVWPGTTLHVDFETATLLGGLIQLVLRKQEEAKILQAHAVERHLVGLVVLAEAAGATSAGCQEDVVVNSFLLATDSHFGLQEVDQAASREDRRTAGADIDQFLAGVEVRASDIGQGFRLVV